MTKKLEIDYETAERITLLTLKDHQAYLKKDLKEFKKGAYMHPEDVGENVLLIEALDKLIKYYGG
jgi:cytochrome c553